MTNNVRSVVSLLPFTVAFLAAGAGGCVLSVDAEVPDVEVTQKGISFAGVPEASVLGEVSMTRSFSQKHSALELPEGFSSEVKAIQVTLTAKDGITDFGFIRYLRLTMSDASDNTNAIDLINYEKDPGATPSATLEMVSANPVNALEKWKTDSALFTINVAGSLPETDWTVDLSVHFAGKFHYQR